MKDRPYLVDSIEVDLGMIKITSRLEHIIGKWTEFPDKKTYVNMIDILAQKIKIDCNNFTEQITPPFDLTIEYEKLVQSPMLEDNFLSKGFNFEQFLIHDIIRIKSEKEIELNMKQSVYTYFMRCLDLNVNYTDKYEP